MENTEIQSSIAELQRRRILGQAGISGEQTRIEVEFLTRYQRVVNMDDLASLELRVKDDNGKYVRLLLGGKNGQWKVPAAKLDCDVFVFVDGERFVGFLTINEVESSPIRWIEEKKQKVDYYHIVSEEFFAPMPETFSFVTKCANIPCDAGGVWDWNMEGWACFGCERFRYDQSAIDWWNGYEQSESAKRSEVSEGA